MTNSQLLESLGADQRTLFNRFCGNETLAMKFIRKFPDDPNYAALHQAYEAKDYDGMEMTSHTIKGIAANLELKKMYALASNICTAVRAKSYEDLSERMAAIDEEYERVAGLIRQLD